MWSRLLCYDGKKAISILYEPLRRDSRPEWVADFAPDFFRSGEANEGKNAFAERREPDFSKYPRTASIYVPKEA